MFSFLFVEVGPFIQCLFAFLFRPQYYPVVVEGVEKILVVDEALLALRRRRRETLRRLHQQYACEVHGLGSLQSRMHLLHYPTARAVLALRTEKPREKNSRAKPVRDLEALLRHHLLVVVQHREVFERHRLCAAVAVKELRERRQKVAEHAGLVHEAKRLGAVPEGEKPEHFFAYARRRGGKNARMALLHRGGRLALYLEAKTGRKPHGPHHAHGIFAKANLGVADRPYDLLLDVLHPADPVDDGKILDVVEKAVDREIAAVGIGLGSAEGVVLVRTLGGMLDYLADRLGILPKSRGLDDLFAEAHVRKTESAAYQEAVAERTADLVGGGGRRDVEILRFAAHE